MRLNLTLKSITRNNPRGFLVSAATLLALFAFTCARDAAVETRSGALGSPVTTTFQDGTAGYAGTTDTQIRQNTPTTNYASGTSINADGDEPANGGQDVSALFRWDISSIPAGSTIQSATITFRITNTTANTYPVLALARSWSESSATWNQAATGTPWQTAGAMGAADRESTSLGRLVAPPVNTTYTVILNAAESVAFIAKVKQWVDNPAQNFGVIVASASNTDGVDVASSENSTAAYRPMLSVTYVAPEPVDAGVDAPAGSGGSGTGGAGTGGSGTGGAGTGGDSAGGGGAGGDSAGGGGAGGDSAGGGGAGGDSVGGGGAGGAAVGGGSAGGGSAGASGTAGAGGAADPGVVFYAAGDIGDRNTTFDTATGLLLDGTTGLIAALGDIAYPNGSSTDFSRNFDGTNPDIWGRHKSRIRPSPGNHEYGTSNASGYFGYFGAVAGSSSTGYYSYNVGAWHIIALNSGRCSSSPSTCISAAQVQWLRNDLAANPQACTLAYWHHPRFSSGEHGQDSSRNSVAPLWDALMEYGADVVLNGHDHNYERWAPQNTAGQAAQNGIVEFVVGTGGTSLRPLAFTPPATSVSRNTTDHGILKLTLRDASYNWQFVPVAGKTFADSGSANCH